MPIVEFFIEKERYEQPTAEVIEIEIEGAVLFGSGDQMNVGCGDKFE